ncbi:MAG: sugar phosphate isomerase/epimerase family protein [Limisphaerales bacterium]
MNNPSRDPIAEMKWMSDLELDFIDLTLEPPGAAPWKIDPKEIRSALNDLNLGVVGHTAFYLPFSCPFESIRQAAVEESKRCIELFAAIGAKWMNLHPDRHAPFHPRNFVIEQNLKSVRELLPTARDCGMGLMIENVPGEFNSRAQLGEMLDAIPELGLHLDIGHCNLQVVTNTATEIITTYGPRIKHVHIHDNKGGYADLHLPLGTGNLDFVSPLKALQAWGYDATITLEVFSDDRQYLSYSRDVLKRTWNSLLPKNAAAPSRPMAISV